MLKCCRKCDPVGTFSKASNENELYAESLSFVLRGWLPLLTFEYETSMSML